jgi:hypothetical protein
MSEDTGNKIDEEKAQRFVDEIERCFVELLSERGTYMARCKPIHERIGDWKDRAKDDGIPKKALNTILKERDLIRKIEALNEDLEDDDADQVEMLRNALGPYGDLPLGRAAVDAEERVASTKPTKAAKPPNAGKKGTAKKDALNSLVDDKLPAEEDGADVRPEFLRRQEEERIAANAQAIKDGITKLN